MKKTFILLVCCWCFFGWSGAPLHAAPPERVLVVYYSRDGHTKMVAEKLAERFTADSERLIDVKKRVGRFATMVAGKDAIAKNTTKIEPLTNDPAEYDVIFIGTPAWFSNMTPAVRTFILAHDLSHKKIGLFATCHRVGADKATAQMAELISPAEDPTYPQLPLTRHDLADDILPEKLTAFINELKEP